MAFTSGLVCLAPFSQPLPKATTGGTLSVPSTAPTTLVSVSRPARAPAMNPALSSLNTRPVRFGTTSPWKASTPMKWVSGLALAAAVVASPRAKPTVSTTSAFLSMKDWMFVS